jgi:hypothetical protein
MERLRAESEAVRAQARDAARPVELALREVDARMRDTLRWLEEALAHLEVIRPAVKHTFAIPSVVSIHSPRYERGFATYRRRQAGTAEVIDYVELFYRLDGGAEVTVPVQLGEARAVEERLTAAHLPHRYEVEHDERRRARRGLFVVTPHVAAMVRFVPEYRMRRVAVTLQNVDRFEPVTLDFPAQGLDEHALEDLVHLILGESNRFLRRAPLAGVVAARARGSDAPKPPLSV